MMTRKSLANDPNKLPLTLEEFGTFLRDLRFKSKLSQRDFSQKIGVSAQAVCNWEKKRALPSDSGVLKNIAKIFRLPARKFLNIKHIRKANYRRELISGSKDPVVHSLSANYVPLLNERLKFLPLDQIKHPAQWMEKRCFLPEGLFPGYIFGFEISDKHMEPNHRQGDIVLVDIQKPIEEGQSVIIKIKGRSPMCRVYSSQNGLTVLTTTDLKTPVVRVRGFNIVWCYGVIRSMNHYLKSVNDEKEK